jgi:chromosome segregation ATPase
MLLEISTVSENEIDRLERHLEKLETNLDKLYDRLDSKFDGVGSKFDAIEDRLSTIDSTSAAHQATLVAQAEQLTYHIRRTDMLEERIEGVAKQTSIDIDTESNKSSKKMRGYAIVGIALGALATFGTKAVEFLKVLLPFLPL